MKKFTSNDIFYNTLLTNPKYSIVMQSGSLRINDQINQNQEKSSSILVTEYTGTYSYKTYTGSYAYSSSVGRTLIYAPLSSGTPVWQYRFSDYSSLLKIVSLKNSFSNYAFENKYANIDYYLYNGGTPSQKKNAGIKLTDLPTLIANAAFRKDYYIRPQTDINLIEIPSQFYGNYIKPGSIQLNMYISGNLTASAADTDKTGKLFQTYGSGSGNIIGSVLYDHGIILITGAYAVTDKQAPYIQPLSTYAGTTSPVVDYLKWIYFGSYSASVGAAPETKYELVFQGANFIPTLTMMCHAEKDELFWSNNRTFIEAAQGDEIFYGQTTSSTDLTGSTYYATSGSVLIPSAKKLKENKTITIKNTISSSFIHYSASYQPQVFISQVGIYDVNRNLIAIAKLANPVRKTKDMDYTFKLKLDI
jgi:hypothetical protein